MNIDTLKKVLKWAGVVWGGSFAFLLIVSIPYLLEKKNTEAQVAKIHATKLTMEDVVGINLPPDPGVEADRTIAGIDANENGIRDDVELAIFKEYPDSAKTRAVLLQYALALQMEMTQSLINKETVTAVAEDEGRAYLCVGKISSREDMNKYSEIVDAMRLFVEGRQLNTDARKKMQHGFNEGNLGSFSIPREVCDIELALLSN